MTSLLFKLSGDICQYETTLEPLDIFDTMNNVSFDDFKRMYDREVVRSMRDSRVPGFSVLITKDEEVVYERSFGNREWETGKPANSDTLYGIASITKSMTSLAILMLQEEGKLSIDDPIKEYIPVDLDKFDDNPIRIRHLMAHASGIPNLGSYGAQIRNQDLTTFNTVNLPVGNWDDFYFHINDANDWIYSPPGTKFYYNNDGYTMLSQIIKVVSGMPYEEFIQTRILAPLDMTRSTFSRQAVEDDDNSSVGYSTDPTEDGITRLPKHHLSGEFQSGAGGLNSSVRELTNYLQMHLKKGEYDGTRLISEDLISLMYQPHNTNMTAEYLYYLPDPTTAYGFGFSITDFHGYTLIRHGGASGVAGGEVAFIPELNITYAHLYNVGWFSSHMMLIALTYMIGKDPYETIPYLKRREHLKKLAGSYVNYRKQLKIEIKVNGGLLSLENNLIDKSVSPLIPVDAASAQPMEFYQYTSLSRLRVLFTELGRQNIIMEIERNIYRKVAFQLESEHFEP